MTAILVTGRQLSPLPGLSDVAFLIPSFISPCFLFPQSHCLQLCGLVDVSWSCFQGIPAVISAVSRFAVS